MNLVLAHVQKKRSLAEVGAGHVAEHVFGPEALRLFAHVFDQLRALNPFRKAGEILHHRGDRELSPGLVSLDHERFQVCASGVKSSRVSGAAGTDDNDVADVHIPSSLDCKKAIWVQERILALDRDTSTVLKTITCEDRKGYRKRPEVQTSRAGFQFFSRF